MASEKKEVKSASVSREEFDGLCAKVRKMSDNWKRFCAVHVGNDKDGEVGSVKVGLLALVALLCVSLVAWGAGELESWSQGTGTATLDQTARTGNITLTIDAIAANSAITGVNSGSGTSALSTVSIANQDYGNMRRATITLASVPAIVTYLGGPAGNPTNSSGAIKIFDFPEGVMGIHGVVVDDLTTATNVNMNATNEISYALGTVTAAGSILTTTEVDLAPTNGITQITNVYDTVLAASVIFDGSATAKDMFLNFIVTDAPSGDFDQNTTNLVSGTVILHYSQLGDN